MNRQTVIKRDFSWPLQKSIYSKLNGSIVKSGNPALVVPVMDFSAVKKTTGYPYITIGDFTETNQDTKTSSGQEMTISISGWSAYGGVEECSYIANQILTILTSDPLDMSADGFECLKFMKDAQIPQAVEGLYRRIILRFRVLIEDVSTVQPVG